MPLLDLGQARAEVRLHDVLELLGWQARSRQGLQVRGPCPVHDSQAATSRVFSAHLGRDVWHCFGCGARATPWTCGPWSGARGFTKPSVRCTTGSAGRCPGAGCSLTKGRKNHERSVAQQAGRVGELGV
jgi:hypothetical protein